jgi:hypothetical protein
MSETTRTSEAKANEATCRTCPFFVPYSFESGIGTCRREPPRPMMTEPVEGEQSLTHENPEVAPFWFCGEHPLRQRDRLAAMAMQGILASGGAKDRGGSYDFESMAVSAYYMAEEMLAAVAKGEV